MKIFTIGFTKKTAEQFFTLLKQPGLERLIDTRLNNVSQLAGFSKKNDLKFFLRVINQIEYLHYPNLAPTKDILDEYKKNGGDWKHYEKKFMKLMEDRQIENKLNPEVINGSCLLCSEPTHEHCHRSLIIKYLQRKWEKITVIHL